MADIFTELRAGIREQLQHTGSARAVLADVAVSAPEWRSPARAAARELGRSVQTLNEGDVVSAHLRDWPANAKEEQILQARMRRAVQG
ncbi:hypothetical protein ITJ57_19065 [Plantibacter sp. VKM Ac-2880]|uniref:hypothetical protein n=1 Tax=Plantibacter sp. VKM Ac-2880 TaxID=2783827 RepID=UPI00188F10C3|nr:hypothetical protein [Plantibacter sp. VKM Ac-2880]MBF4570874.1 hypothetical protein [Plantibacter sp. VKM Ac-2880]